MQLYIFTIFSYSVKYFSVYRPYLFTPGAYSETSFQRNYGLYALIDSKNLLNIFREADKKVLI